MGFRESAAGDQIREYRARSDSSSAALDFETSFENSVTLHANGKTQDVAANRVCHFHYGCGIQQSAGIMRMLEVFEDFIVVSHH